MAQGSNITTLVEGCEGWNPVGDLHGKDSMIEWWNSMGWKVALPYSSVR